MCCIFWTLHHPHYQLIVASNRDEYLSRPSAPAALHSFDAGKPTLSAPSSLPYVYSGLDLSGGGTWLGITKTGRFAVLTNFTEPPPRHKVQSRGRLVKDFLASQNPTAPQGQPGAQGSAAARSPLEYVKEVERVQDEFAGFNLLVGQCSADSRPEPSSSSSSSGSCEVAYVSNREPAGSGGARLLVSRSASTPSQSPLPAVVERDGDVGVGSASGTTTTGCVACGLSNSTFLDPWEKVGRGERAFMRAIDDWDRVMESEAKEGLVERLFDVLSYEYRPQLTERSQMRVSIQIPPVRLSPPSKPVDTTSQAAHEGHEALCSGADGGADGSPSGAGAGAGAAAAATSDWYATRTATVLLVDRRGNATFVERDVYVLDQRGCPTKGVGRRVFEFALEPEPEPEPEVSRSL